MPSVIRCRVPDPAIRLRQRAYSVVSVAASAWGGAERWSDGRTWDGLLLGNYTQWGGGQAWQSGDAWSGASAASLSGNLRASVRVNVRT